MIAFLTSISPETLFGLLISLAVILLSGLTVVHILSVQEAERRRG